MNVELNCLERSPEQPQSELTIVMFQSPWILTEELYEALRAIIEAHSGLHLNLTDRHLFEKKIGEIAQSRHFSSLKEYIDHLRFDSKGEREIPPLIDQVTNNETYFFREKAHFELLRNDLIPKLTRNNALPIRVWSAGCSTGEEPYTIAIVLKELAEVHPFAFEIIATDIDITALKRAAKGIFTKNSFRGMDPGIIDRYFTQIGTEWGLDARICQLVDFRHLNQVNGEYPAGDLTHIDIIFYRNVSIYFDPATNQKILHKLYDTLKPGGYLIPGTTETMQYRTNPFTLLESESVFYLQKTITPTTTYRPFKLAVTKPKTLKPKSILRQKEHELGTATQEKSKKLLSIKQAVKYLIEHKFDMAADILNGLIEEKMEEEEALVLLANLQFNRGNLESAEEIIERLLMVNDIHPEAFLLLGMIKKSSGDLVHARQHLQKALFLQANMWIANYHLAEIYRSTGKASQARREYSNTLKKIRKEKTDDWELYLAGFSQDYLIRLCEQQIQTLPA